MTTAGRREARFGDITKVRRIGALFYAMSGSRNTVIIAENFNGLAQVQGETPDLGAEARDITRNFLGGSDVYYILTDDGVQLADATVQVPILGAKVNFDPGDGRWILSTYNDAVTPYIVTPVDGGIQVLDQSGVRTSVSTPAGVGGCRDAVIGSDDVLYVVDEVRAKIHVWRIIGPKAIYIDSFRAMNCRNVVKVVLDEDVNVMFVQCKHRIVGFNVTPPYSADSDIRVTLRQDYGKLAEDYTDFVKIGTNKYWVGVDADSPLNAGSAFLGRTYAAWDVGNDVLFAAFPDTSLFAASNVIPYVGEDLIPIIPDIIPPVVPPVIPVVPPVIPPPVAPPAPVITSSLVTSLTEDTLLSYTITATGTGPIYYDLGARPPWVTSINHTTGVVLGMPPDPGTFNITITATNAGGTDTEILVVTVAPALASLAAVSVNNSVLWIEVVGSVAYIGGTFTSVTDASGTLTRNHAAALDLPTGLWTAWNPAPNANNVTAIKLWQGQLYIGGDFTTIGGQSKTRLARVNLTTGAADASWTQNANGSILSMYASDKLYVCGGTSLVNGSSVGPDGVLAYNASGIRTSWETNDSAGIYGVLDSNGTTANDIVEVGGVLYRVGQGRIGLTTTGREIFAISGSNGWSVNAQNAKEFNAGGYSGAGGPTTISANLVVGAPLNSAVTWVNAGGVVGDYTRGSVIRITSSCNIDLSYNPTFNGAARRIVSRGSTDYIAGDFTTVNGATKRLLVRLASGGSTDTVFSPAITVATDARAIALYSSSLLVGVFGNAATVSGVSKGFFFAVHQDTGALQ